MTAPAPSELPLRDIRLPDPISWWPLAPGWLLVAGLAVTAIIAGLWLWFRYRRFAMQRAAHAELDGIEQMWTCNQDPHRCARQLSNLARRVAVAHAGESLAATTGIQWLRALERIGGQALPAELNPVLLEAPYSSARAAALDPESVTATAAIVRAWINGTRNGKARSVEHV